MSNYKTVFFTLGILQIILGLSMIAPILAQFFYDELDSSFISSGIVTIIFGVLFLLSNLDHDKKISLPQAFLLTALSWLSIAIFGSLPFIFSEIELSVTDAFKERLVEEGYNPSYGARPLRRAVMRLLEDSLAEEVLSGRIKDGDKALVDIDAVSYTHLTLPTTAYV